MLKEVKFHNGLNSHIPGWGTPQLCGPDCQLSVRSGKLSYHSIDTGRYRPLVTSRSPMRARPTQVLSMPSPTALCRWGCSGNNTMSSATQPDNSDISWSRRIMRAALIREWVGQLCGSSMSFPTPLAFISKTPLLYCCSCFFCVQPEFSIYRKQHKFKFDYCCCSWECRNLPGRVTAAMLERETTHTSRLTP